MVPATADRLRLNARRTVRRMRIRELYSARFSYASRITEASGGADWLARRCQILLLLALREAGRGLPGVPDSRAAQECLAALRGLSHGA